MSKVAIPREARVARCSGLSLSARMPPWMAGCRVLTRPPMISGKPVTSLTEVTVRPASVRSLRVPPVETSSTPAALRNRASSGRPVLSVTLKMARLMGRSSMGILAFSGRGATLVRDWQDHPGGA